MGMRIGFAAFAVLVIVQGGCATGETQGFDTWVYDTGHDGTDGTGDALPDSAFDPWADTTDTTPDPYVDTTGDTIPDALDVTDTMDAPGDTPVDIVADDVAGDLPTTCTVVDLVNQTMCGAGRKCTFVAIDASGNPIPICDTAGPQGWNQACGAGGVSDNCQAGYICLGDGSTNVCRRYCSSDSTCTSYPGGPNAACEIGINHGGTTVIGVTTCSFHCDPLYQTGCNAGQSCRANFPGDYTFFSDCGTAGSGTACMAGTGQDCPVGQDCFNINDGYGTCNACLRYCGYSSGYPACSGLDTCSQGTGWSSTIGVCFDPYYVCP